MRKPDEGKPVNSDTLGLKQQPFSCRSCATATARRRTEEKFDLSAPCALFMSLFCVRLLNGTSKTGRSWPAAGKQAEKSPGENSFREVKEATRERRPRPVSLVLMLIVGTRERWRGDVQDQRLSGLFCFFFLPLRVCFVFLEG